LLEVHRADIHDQPNWLLVYAIEGDAALQDARLAVESVYREPRPGDSIVVHRVLGEAVEVRKADA
jgi:hypothetical protein